MQSPELLPDIVSTPELPRIKTAPFVPLIVPDPRTRFVRVIPAHSVGLRVLAVIA
jgi:hypothetical protein